jgi:hypothetical protein
MKTTSCTEKKFYSFDLAPRCGARTKRNNGLPCRNPAVKEKSRCRLHGGAKGSGAKLGNSNAISHGFTTRQNKILKEQIKESLKATKSFLKIFSGK